MARTRLGVAGSIWLGGVLCIAGTAALAAALPRFLRYNGETAWPARRPPTRRGSRPPQPTAPPLRDAPRPLSRAGPSRAPRAAANPSRRALEPPPTLPPILELWLPF